MTQSSNWEQRAKSAIRKETIKEFAGWSEKDLIAHIIELRETVNTLQKEAKHKGAAISEATIASQFDKAWSVATKIVFILHLLNKPLLSSEVYKKLIGLDKSFKDFSSSKTVLSNYLTRSVKSGRIKKVKLPGIKTHYFVLPEWLNENGILKEEYQSFIPKF